MKRDLFVYAGQSNMMGASVLPPSRAIECRDSHEYKHKARRLGKDRGDFVTASYPVGEFSYTDVGAAYAPGWVDDEGRSLLSDYIKNTYFCPAMSNLLSKDDLSVSPFSEFSESTAKHGATLAPFVAEGLEKLSRPSAYAHMAKGGVSIDFYFTEEMRDEYAMRIKAYNAEHNTTYDEGIPDAHPKPGAPKYFIEKCKDFFADAESCFGDELSGNRCLVWLQGEADAYRSDVEYEIKLDVLWEHIKPFGFTHIFIVRVDYFGDDRIERIMRAQESFVKKHGDAYMLTRVASFLAYPNQDEDSWFDTPPNDDERLCRDSFFGYNNNHINEKGFMLIAERCVKNIYRVLEEGKQPILENEKIKALL